MRRVCGVLTVASEYEVYDMTGALVQHDGRYVFDAGEARLVADLSGGSIRPAGNTQPMREDELGRYVCVARGGCQHSPHLTINADGVWVRYPDSLTPGSYVYSSAHRTCYECGECSYLIPCAVLRAAAEGVSGLLGEMLASRTCGCDKLVSVS